MVVTGGGEVAAGGQHLLFGIEHVEIGPHADLQAELGGVELGLAGGERLFQGLYAGGSAVHGEPGVACPQAGFADAFLKFLTRPFLVGDGFANAVNW